MSSPLGVGVRRAAGSPDRERQTRKLVFIDRARGVRNLQALLEAESDGTLSVRRFAERLLALGLLSRHRYPGSDELRPGRAVAGDPRGAGGRHGRRQIDALRRLDQAAGQLWQQLGIDDAFAPGWAALLRRYDGERWDFDAFRAALEKELEVTTDRDPFDVADA